MDKESLLQAILQTTDSLSFTVTHKMDMECRMHSLQSVESVTSLQQEQRCRIERQFGPVIQTPKYLEQQLFTLYRGEIASLSLYNLQNGPDVFLRMPLHLLRRLKSDIKLRLLQWEASYRRIFGVVASFQDRAIINPIYQLHTAIKERIAAKGEFHISLSRTESSLTNVNSAVVSGMNASPVSTGVTPTLNCDPSASTQPIKEKISPQIPLSNKAVLGKDKLYSKEEICTLRQKKIELKQFLRHFENNFEKEHNRRPSRTDRTPYANEYYQYTLIKAMLNEYDKAEKK